MDTYDCLENLTHRLMDLFPKMEPQDVTELTDAIHDLIKSVVEEHRSDYDHTPRERY